MGWTFTGSYFGQQGKAELVEHLTRNEFNQETGVRWTLVDYRLGQKQNNQPLWSVWDLSKNGTPITRYIRCDLIACWDDDGWGYKDEGESCGPFYYDCPLSFLAMTPVRNQTWRNQVLQHHASLKQSKLLAATVEKGDIMLFKDLSIQKGIFVRKHKTSLVLSSSNKLMVLPPRMFKNIVAVNKSQQLCLV